MITTILISIIGAVTAIAVSLVGAWLANRNSIVLQTRKLKEDHYVSYVEALHNLAAENENMKFMEKFVMARDKLLLIASEDVIKKMLAYEEEAVGKNIPKEVHDKYLTEMIKAIRKDLKIIDKDFPNIYFKKSRK